MDKAGKNGKSGQYCSVLVNSFSVNEKRRLFVTRRGRGVRVGGRFIVQQQRGTMSTVQYSHGRSA